MSGSDSTYAAILGDGGTVLERVLLAIINAHTIPATDGRQLERLDAAMNALTGAGWPANPARDAALSKALDFMARERQRDVCDRDMDMLRTGGGKVRPVRSVRELATMAASEILDCADRAEQNDASERLAAVFNDRCREFRTVSYDAAREAMETEAIRRLCAELAEWDVPTRL